MGTSRPGSGASVDIQNRLAIEGGTPVRDSGYPPWPPHSTAEIEGDVLDVLRSGKWGASDGRLGVEFAQRFAERHGAQHGLVVANGTLGLFAALRALGVRPGDEVIVPAYTFIATATAVLLAGAMPVFADVDPESLLLDPQSVRAATTDRTRAVVPVHLAGAAADVDAVRDALPAGAPIGIVEDAAQAHGAAWRGRPVGSLGDLSCFSFQSSKNMTAGEGGAILANSEDLFRRVYSAVNVGRSPGGGWYEHAEVGWNLRMTELQSATLLRQLASLDDANRRCADAASALADALTDVPGVHSALVPEGVSQHAWHLFLLHLDLAAFGGRGKTEVARAIAAEGVPCSPGYVALDQNEALRRAVVDLGGPTPVATPCRAADLAQQRTIWFPRRVLCDGLAGALDAARAIVKVQRGFAGS